MANYLDLNGTTDVVGRLKGSINEKASNDDVQLIVDELALKADKTEVEAVKERVDEIEAYKFPNVTIFGTPQISNGQMSGFSNVNYAQFPFLVDFKGQRFEINMCFTTGENVTEQQNIIDSQFGLAMAVRNGKFVIAMSSNGTSWDMGEHVGIVSVSPMATYYVKLTWDGSAYDLLYSVDKKTYSTDIHYVDSKTLFPRRIVIGKGVDDTHIFGGSINLNYCSLSIVGHEVWAGMDDVGLATRLATDLSNIDDAGVEKVNEIVRGGGYITQETDPTVPAHVKAITEADIAKWNEGGGGGDYPIYQNKQIVDVYDDNAIILNAKLPSFRTTPAPKSELKGKPIHVGAVVGIRTNQLTTNYADNIVITTTDENGSNKTDIGFYINGSSAYLKVNTNATSSSKVNYAIKIWCWKSGSNSSMSKIITSYNRSDYIASSTYYDFLFIEVEGITTSQSVMKWGSPVTIYRLADDTKTTPIAIVSKTSKIDNFVSKVLPETYDGGLQIRTYFANGTDTPSSPIQFPKINGEDIIGSNKNYLINTNYLTDSSVSGLLNGKGMIVDMSGMADMQLQQGVPFTITSEIAAKRYTIDTKDVSFGQMRFNVFTIEIQNMGETRVMSFDMAQSGVCKAYSKTTDEEVDISMMETPLEEIYFKFTEGPTITYLGSENDPIFAEEVNEIGFFAVENYVPHRIALEDNLKTINGQSIVGTGDITVGGGGGGGDETDPIWTAEKVNYSTTEEMNVELEKKQDKLTNTTTMEVTYEDGTTETITLYKV